MENSALRRLLEVAETNQAKNEEELVSLNDTLAKNLTAVMRGGNTQCGQNSSCADNGTCNGNHGCSGNGVCNTGCGQQL